MHEYWFFGKQSNKKLQYRKRSILNITFMGEKENNICGWKLLWKDM